MIVSPFKYGELSTAFLTLIFDNNVCTIYPKSLVQFSSRAFVFYSLGLFIPFFLSFFAWILIQGFEHIPDPGRNSVCAATFFKYICNYIRVQQEICSCSKVGLIQESLPAPSWRWPTGTGSSSGRIRSAENLVEPGLAITRGYFR